MTEADTLPTGTGSTAGDPVPAFGMPVLHLGAYDGPLDLLLELARAQRIDFAALSMADLAAQFGVAVEAAIAGETVPLGQVGDWLVAAATLLALRARLLLPADAPERRDADREAATLRDRLTERAAMQRLADWLAARPQLGRDVFGRGMAEAEADGPPVADITALLRACLQLLEQPRRTATYRPAPPPLWRVPAALAHLRTLLPTLPAEGVTLTQLVPAPELTGDSPLQRRAAIASLLMGGLELSREGVLRLEQAGDFDDARASRAVRHP